jgi:hypothetical protein
VTSTLNARTDYYSLPAGAVVPTAPYDTQSAFVDYLDSNGAVLRTNGLETTVPINAVPDGNTVETSTPGGALVKGLWQVKGAYFMVRVGPSFRLQLTERLGVNASLGVAGAYAGTIYSVAETFSVPDMPETLVGSSVGTEHSSETKFLHGYYADFNMEWAANERTGLFGGLTAQKLGDYDQSIGGRTARIDLGSAVGIRAGVNIKF